MEVIKATRVSEFNAEKQNQIVSPVGNVPHCKTPNDQEPFQALSTTKCVGQLAPTPQLIHLRKLSLYAHNTLDVCLHNIRDEKAKYQNVHKIGEEFIFLITPKIVEQGVWQQLINMARK